MPPKKTRSSKAPDKGSSIYGRMQDAFGHFAQKTAQVTGKPITFLLAVAVILVWAFTGPLFHYSDTWQLVINTGTTIVTFLMVFLIQNTQNRDTMAIQLKLGEVILGMEGVPNRFATIEDLSDEDLETLHESCRLRADKALEHLNQRHAGKGGKPSNASK